MELCLLGAAVEAVVAAEACIARGPQEHAAAASGQSPPRARAALEGACPRRRGWIRAASRQGAKGVAESRDGQSDVPSGAVGLMRCCSLPALPARRGCCAAATLASREVANGSCHVMQTSGSQPSPEPDAVCSASLAGALGAVALPSQGAQPPESGLVVAAAEHTLAPVATLPPRAACQVPARDESDRSAMDGAHP